ASQRPIICLDETCWMRREQALPDRSAAKTAALTNANSHARQLRFGPRLAVGRFVGTGTRLVMRNVIFIFVCPESVVRVAVPTSSILHRTPMRNEFVRYHGAKSGVGTVHV